MRHLLPRSDLQDATCAGREAAAGITITASANEINHPPPPLPRTLAEVGRQWGWAVASKQSTGAGQGRGIGEVKASETPEL